MDAERKRKLPGGDKTRAGMGRPKGSRNKYTQLKSAFLEAFDELGGVRGLVEWARKSNANRTQFYHMIKTMLPKEVELKNEEDFTINLITNIPEPGPPPEPTP